MFRDAENGSRRLIRLFAGTRTRVRDRKDELIYVGRRDERRGRRKRGFRPVNQSMSCPSGPESTLVVSFEWSVVQTGLMDDPRVLHTHSGSNV